MMFGFVFGVLFALVRGYIVVEFDDDGIGGEVCGGTGD